MRRDREGAPGLGKQLPALHAPRFSSHHFPRGSGVSEVGTALHCAWAPTLRRCSQGQHQGHTLALPGEPPGRAEPRVHAGQAASIGCPSQASQGLRIHLPGQSLTLLGKQSFTHEDTGILTENLQGGTLVSRLSHRDLGREPGLPAVSLTRYAGVAG